MKEIWKDINEYPNYMVSNMGNVKSLNYKHTGREKILKSSVDKIGYMYVGLCKNGVKKKCQVHRLVAEAFYGEIPNGMQVNHINEIKTDNRLENLNLMTPKENCNWGTRNKRVAEKATNGKCSKPVLKIDPISNEIVAEFPSLREVERQLGISNSSILKCCKGGYFCKGRNKWVNVSQAYGYKWQYKKEDY